MNITRAMAEAVSKQLTVPMQKKIDVISGEVQKLADDEILSQLSKDLLEAFLKYPAYFKKSTCATFKNGTQEIVVSYCTPFPIENCAWNKFFLCSPEFAEKVTKLEAEKKVIKDEQSKTEQSIISALVSLRTFKKAKESFPDAYKYLSEYEKPVSNAIALPVSNIMETIGKYNISA